MYKTDNYCCVSGIVRSKGNGGKTNGLPSLPRTTPLGSFLGASMVETLAVS